MTEQEVHNLIEDCDKEDRNRLHDRALESARQAVDDRQNKQVLRTRLLRRLVPIAAAVLVVVCLCVVLPLTLQTNTADESVRYLDSQLSTEILDCNLKEFARQNQLDILYLDWYSKAEFVELTKYVPKEDVSKIAYLFETIINEDGIMATYCVVAENVSINTFEEFIEVGDSDTLTLDNGAEVSYTALPLGVKAMFNYNGYKYYLELDTPDMSVLKAALESMF